jgi:addiction module HigA family antidote
MNNANTLHPGQILNDQFLIPKQISINTFATQTGITENHIKDLISGRRSVSKTTAKILAQNLDTHPQYWMDLQREYDFYITRKLLKGIIPDDDAIESVMINNPHDKLIKIVFSDRQEAVEFFQNKLPQEIVKNIDWDTLELEGSNYIDEEMQGSESDLVYSVDFKNGRDKCFLYLLFEHQSTPDKWVRYRIVKYKTRIWDQSFQKNKDQDQLIPILSMVFYMGESNWNISPEFSDLFCETHVPQKYLPSFEHILLDYSNKSLEFKGAIKIKIAHMLIQAHFKGCLKELFQPLMDAFSLLSQDQGLNYSKIFFIYVATTQKYETFKEFVQMIRHNYKEKQGGKHMIRALDELRMEGRMEGELKSKIAIVESMRINNYDWQSIYQVTGIDSDRLEEMKAELLRIQTLSLVAADAMNQPKYSQQHAKY